ncbi:NUDIX hydrolase family protein [Streptomyces thinghirensis]|nr:NUDIX hydrolase family protein [Streptomyces thinghirensis]
MSDTAETTPGWLSTDELEMARARMPILYVEAVPVRVDDSGEVTSVGLHRASVPTGTVSRTLVSGQVLHHERVRDALLRHLEKDLGAVALPRCRPRSSRSRWPNTSPRTASRRLPRSAAARGLLAYVVPVAGDCRPAPGRWTWSGSARRRALSPAVQSEMPGGHGVLLKQALAHVGCVV